MSEAVVVTKVCTACEEAKDLAHFPPDLRRKDGCGSKCRSCADVAKADYYARYPEKEAERRRKNAGHGAAWYRRNRGTQIERMRWSSTQRRYGVSREQYLGMLEKQSGACAICRTTDPGRENGYFAVDHDHLNGRVRGLLCHPCNTGIGMLQDSPAVMRLAAEYIERSHRG